MMHSDWLKLVTCVVVANRNALLQRSIAILLENLFMTLASEANSVQESPGLNPH